MDATAFNVSKGLAGFALFYTDWELKLIRDGVLPGLGAGSCNDPDQDGLDPDPALEDPENPGYYAPGREPFHNPYDLPMVFQDKVIDLATGQVAYDSDGHNGYLGDTFFVNGEAWPRKRVVNRKYRFRLLNGSNARVFRFRLLAEADFIRSQQAGLNADEMAKAAKPFLRIGKDSCLWSEPLTRTSVVLAVANRADLIVDFGGLTAKAGPLPQAFYLVDTMPQFDGRGPKAKLEDGGDPRVLPLPFDVPGRPLVELNKPIALVKFVVEPQSDEQSKVKEASVDIGTPLAPLRPPIPVGDVKVVREFILERGKGAWQVNGRFYDPTIANAAPNLVMTDTAAEEWVLRNGGGGWWHPIHIHLESHQLVSYEKDFEADEIIDPPDAPPRRRQARLVDVTEFIPQPEAVGNHDTQILGRNLGQYAYKPEWSMFLEEPGVGGKGIRQITNRNSPTTANAVFSDRQFHDGRAESTFNGFSIFGDHDRRQVLFKRRADGPAVPVHVAIPKASLASQAVGPIVNEVEMSYLGRTFPDLAEKLLPSQWLEHQTVSPDDSVLAASALYADAGKTNRLTYEQLIRKAFRPEWYDVPAAPDEVSLRLRAECARQDADKKGPLTKANFSLFWGLSIMLYESTLISNRTPFDDMMQGRGDAVNARWDVDYKPKLGPIVRTDLAPVRGDGAGPKLELKTGTEVFQFGFRTFLNRGCIECHAGPLFSEVFDRAAAAEPEPKLPIAFTMERTLLPNAQGDAIALKAREFRGDTEVGLQAELAALHVPAPRREAWVNALWRLLEGAAGDLVKLESLVAEALAEGRPVAASAPEQPHYAAIAKLLMTFEKTVSTRVGGRTFFTEDERVALAEKLAVGVLVEKMLIPGRQRLEPEPNPRAVIRPRLPIEGPPATEAYAFYDAGFYALGVSPPRFDRGIGVWTGGEQDELTDDPMQPEPDKEYAKVAQRSELRQAAGGARGRAYQLRSGWKVRSPVQNPPSHCDPDTDPAVTANAVDLSWNRNLVPPGSGTPDLESDQRRSRLHFFSRSRRLVFDEEPTGHRKPFLHDNELAFWGAFKTPSLRNVELTAPYMHNGRFYDLAAVIEFYDSGGALWQRPDTNPDKHPAMEPLHLTDGEQKALRFFLACLTDPRVRAEKAPFDHPSLIVVNGYGPIGGRVGAEQLVDVNEVGRAGRADSPPLPEFPPR